MWLAKGCPVEIWKQLFPLLVWLINQHFPSNKEGSNFNVADSWSLATQGCCHSLLILYAWESLLGFPVSCKELKLSLQASVCILAIWNPIIHAMTTLHSGNKVVCFESFLNTHWESTSVSPYGCWPEYELPSIWNYRYEGCSKSFAPKKHNTDSSCSSYSWKSIMLLCFITGILL